MTDGALSSGEMVLNNMIVYLVSIFKCVNNSRHDLLLVGKFKQYCKVTVVKSSVYAYCVHVLLP